jgi:predicted nucleotide-binding protein
MKSGVNPKDVFVVHGHDHGIKETIARFLSKLKLNPIVLHEQPNKGNTVIEKFEQHSGVSFAIAIFSHDDLGIAKADISTNKTLEESVRPRARQNVVLEFGYFLGALGRKNVVAIIEDGVETPSDYSGVLYIPYDAADGWRLRLVKELKAAGLDVDANAAF